MKNWITYFAVLMTSVSFAQQDAIYSQYIFNQAIINPAYVGSRNSMSAILLHRTRWVGFDGAPTTSTFSYGTDLKKNKMAWGGNFIADRLGPTTNIIANVSGAYHLKMRSARLAFGLRLGVFNSSLNTSKLDLKDPTDILNGSGQRESAILPSLDFGMYYYTRRFFVGLSLNHLGAAGKFNYDSYENATFPLNNFNTLTAGYAFQVADNVVLKPSIMFKQSADFDSNLDINLNALFYKKVWFGISIRTKISINAILEVNITDYMRFGYSYDFFLNSLQQASGGAHEFFIGFDFVKDKMETVSPRLL